MHHSEPLIIDPEEVEPQLGDFIKHHDFDHPVPNIKGVEYVFMADHDLLSISKTIKSEFMNAFTMARESYVDGDWVNAQLGINNALSIVPNDGPCKWMMSYLEKSKMLAPEDWIGVRDIDKKLEPPAIDFLNKEDDEWNEDEDQDIS